MKNHLRTTVAFLLVLLFVMSVSHFELYAQKKFEGYWQVETITKSTLPMQPAKKIEQQKNFYKNGKMKTVNLTDKKTTIFRFDKGLAWTIDHKNKTYYEMFFDQMGMGMKNAMSESMKDMDHEEKEMMKKMMGNKAGSLFGNSGSLAISFEHTGKTRTIKGYKCHQVIMNLGGKPMMEMWLTNKYSLGDDFLKIYQKMGLIKGEIPKDSKLKGFPILTKMDMGMGKMETETTVTKIVKTKVSESEFEVPRGYKKLDNPIDF